MVIIYMEHVLEMVHVNFYILLNVHPNIMIVFFTNLVHKFFILSSRNLWSELSPKERGDARCCTNTIVLLKMSIIVLETCRGV